jgi:hypothetical protein
MTVSYPALTLLHEHNSRFLLDLFHATMTLGYCAKKWKWALCFLLPKQGKPKDTPKGYGPISLLFNISNLMEETIASQIAKIASCPKQEQFPPPNVEAKRPTPPSTASYTSYQPQASTTTIPKVGPEVLRTGSTPALLYFRTTLTAVLTMYHSTT